MIARKKPMACLALTIVCMLLMAGCSSRGVQPRRTGDWMVELVEVQVGAADFNLSLLGEPLDMEIVVLENGRPVKPSSDTRLSGRRGQRILERPLTWLIHYDPQRTYQVVVEEQALVARSSRWELPPTPRLNEWPFAARDGVLRFGTESYLRFAMRKVKS